VKKNFRILHLCQDEKFIDGVIYLFEKAFPGLNKFVVMMPPANPPIKYITNTNCDIDKIVQSKNSGEELVLLEKSYDVVVLHGLNYLTAELVIKSDNKNKFLWSVLGAELYQNKQLYSLSLLGSKTELLFNSVNSKVKIKDSIRRLYHKVRYNFIIPNSDSSERITRAASQIENFGSLIKEEFNFLRDNNLLAPNATFQKLTYYPIEHFDNDTDITLFKDSNLLVGNSASFTNNHLEIFDILKIIGIGSRKIIVPISYGNKQYQKSIIKAGNDLFGDQFVPLVNFLPIKAYNEVIQSCGISIMNHYRQQGVGNILQSLWHGRKVYLSEKNMLFRYFNRIGCSVFSIEKELSTNNPNALKLLSEVEVEHNRRILKSEISEKTLVKQLRNGFYEQYN